MNINEIIKNNEANIRKALEDYKRHTYQTGNLDEISDDFIVRLANDSAYAKQALRELFSKSPAWVPELDALVINGNRTHNKDYRLIYELALQILADPYRKMSIARDVDNCEKLMTALLLFTEPDPGEETKNKAIAAINSFAPGAYQPGRKLSKVFRKLCVALGVADETAGSRFQRLYAQLADEMNAEKISFKLFVSINPAHFLTMSNPKGDTRGQTMTSCHSLNNTEYDYNNGCTGYARDDVSFIVFTVDDPTDAESLNNRKTTRQVFAYRPGSGLLLQSRMYTKAGGVYGTAATDTVKLYRDLIQREICMLEDVPNLWKTYDAYKKLELAEEYDEFGGYADWKYSSFECHISIRNGTDEETVEPLVVGRAGLCIICGEETSEGLYCDDHRVGRNYCEHCENYTDEDLTGVYDRNGNFIEVCPDCLAEHYEYCARCGEYHLRDDMVYVEDSDEWYCSDCFEYVGTYCDECEEAHLFDDLVVVTDEDGYEHNMCQDCAESVAIICPHCGSFVQECSDGTCPNCGAVIHDDDEGEGEVA